MAIYSGFAWDATFRADVDLSAKQWYFVTTASTAGYVKTATGASGPVPLGVQQNDPKIAGDGVTVRLLGTTKVYADAASAIAYGDFITSGSNGLAVLQAPSASAPSVTKPIAGIAMEALSSGSGVLIEVLLLPFAQNLTDNTP